MKRYVQYYGDCILLGINNYSLTMVINLVLYRL